MTIYQAKRRETTETRNDSIVALAATGVLSYAAIGKPYGISRQRVAQIVKRHKQMAERNL